MLTKLLATLIFGTSLGGDDDVGLGGLLEDAVAVVAIGGDGVDIATAAVGRGLGEFISCGFVPVTSCETLVLGILDATRFCGISCAQCSYICPKARGLPK